MQEAPHNSNENANQPHASLLNPPFAILDRVHEAAAKANRKSLVDNKYGVFKRDSLTQPSRPTGLLPPPRSKAY